MFRLYSRRTKILFLVLLILASAITGLWYIGKTPPIQELSPEYRAILEENAYISNLIEAAYKKTGALTYFEAGSVDKIYKTEDLKVLKDNSKQSIQVYSQNLKKALAPVSLVDQNPISLLLDAIDNQNPESVKKLLTISSLYQTATTQLVATPVPSTATIAHLRLIHTLNELRFITLAMSEIQTEPIKATQAGEYFADTFRKLLADFNFINKYFESSGIIFDNSNKIIFVDFTLQWK